MRRFLAPSCAMLGSIDAVIEKLDTIIETSIAEASPAGYFAALYRRVTVTVAEAIRERKFEDNARMEELDIRFAQRYFDAADCLPDFSAMSRSWDAAFQQTDNRSLIVLQHLLLGMNAHISLDLGISAAAVADPRDPLSLKPDFHTINAILGSMIDDTQERLTRFFGPLGIVDRLLGPVDESISLFSIAYARDKAWTQALELVSSPDERHAGLITERDHLVTGFSAQLVHPPKWSIRLLLRLIRLLEKGDVRSRIRILSEMSARPG